MAKKKNMKVEGDATVKDMKISVEGLGKGPKWNDQWGNTIYRTDSKENQDRLKKLEKPKKSKKPKK